MVIHPLYYFLMGERNWEYLQTIWNQWQSLNVGVLALTSSVIGLNISRYHFIRSQHRKFIAAKAFLPQVLSSLAEYFQSSAAVLIEAYPRINNSADNCKTPLQSIVMDLPMSYKEVFRDCIEYAEADVGDYLAYFLQNLQIHHSRLKNLEKHFQQDSKKIYFSLNSEFYGLGELQALVNRLFSFSRNGKPLDTNPLTYHEFHTAYCNLDIIFDKYKGLIEMTTELTSKKSN